MSKETLLKIAFVAAALGVSSVAYAQDFSDSTTLSIGAQKPKPSNHVTIRCVSTAGAYAAQSWHASGDRYFGTNSTEPKIYWKSATTTTLGTSADTVTATDVYTGAGWSAL